MNFWNTIVDAYDKQFDLETVCHVENVLDQIPLKLIDLLTDIINTFELELEIEHNRFFWVQQKPIYGCYGIYFSFEFEQDSTWIYARILIQHLSNNELLFAVQSSDLEYVYQKLKRFIENDF